MTSLIDIETWAPIGQLFVTLIGVAVGIGVAAFGAKKVYDLANKATEHK